jgi:hypothetical protein
MKSMGEGQCPFDFNMDPATFKVGDLVSYRIPGKFDDFPFMGSIVAVHDSWIEITSDPNDPDGVMRATRESRPIVHDSQVR